LCRDVFKVLSYSSNSIRNSEGWITHSFSVRGLGGAHKSNLGMVRVGIGLMRTPPHSTWLLPRGSRVHDRRSVFGYEALKVFYLFCHWFVCEMTPGGHD
jgi:hypothetical protein